jgi:hypothetical protein
MPRVFAINHNTANQAPWRNIQAMHHLFDASSVPAQVCSAKDYCIMNCNVMIKSNHVLLYHDAQGCLQPIGHNTANRSPMAGHIQAMHRTSLMVLPCRVCSAKDCWYSCNVMK